MGTADHRPLLQGYLGTDLLRADSWQKSAQPVFRQDAKAGVYAPSHNGFFRSADGKQDWIIYHANSAPHEGCGSKRSPRMQPLTWRADGTPDFGTPVAPALELDKPAGTP